MRQAGGSPRLQSRLGRCPPGTLAILVRHDACRPASWLAVALAGASAAFVFAGLAATVAGLVVLSAAAVVAIGDVPAGFSVWDSSLMLRRRGWNRFSRSALALPAAGVWVCGRLGWPVLGLAIAAGLLAGGGTAEPLLAAGLLAVLLAGMTAVGLRLAGLSAADAATATLLAGWLAAASVALADGLLPSGGGLSGLLIGLGGWLIVTAGLLLAEQSLRLAGPEPVAGMLPRQLPAGLPGVASESELLATVGLMGVLPARSPWRRALRTTALLVALGGMIGWLLLNPLAAGRYGLLAAALFGGLALPASALLDGRTVLAGWRRLLATSCGGDPRSLGWLAVPTPQLQATVVLAGHALLILWPPLVVAVVALGNPAAGTALVTAAGLAAATAVISGGCVTAHALACSGETVLGVALCLEAACGWVWLAFI